MTDQVVSKSKILGHRPPHRPILYPGCDHDGKTHLSVQPTVLHDISVDQHPLGVLQLEEVLGQPPPAPAWVPAGAARPGVGEGGRLRPRDTESCPASGLRVRGIRRAIHKEGLGRADIGNLAVTD